MQRGGAIFRDPTRGLASEMGSGCTHAARLHPRGPGAQVAETTSGSNPRRGGPSMPFDSLSFAMSADRPMPIHTRRLEIRGLNVLPSPSNDSSTCRAVGADEKSKLACQSDVADRGCRGWGPIG